MEECFSGIDREHGHLRALQLIPDDFFWDCCDELAPFGSDEGHTALDEYRDWRKNNPDQTLEQCVIWTIECVGEMDAMDYTDAIFDESTVREQIDDPDFDDQQFIYTTDISVIATIFGQFADEGKIEPSAKQYAERALKRQIVWAKLQQDWAYASEYINNLLRLQSVLVVA